MRILLVSSHKSGCGISEHSDQLREAALSEDPSIAIVKSAEALDPTQLPDGRRFDLIHLNYHAALTARWQPTHIAALQQAGCRVTATYHDTGVPNSAQCQAIVDAADATVIHEPADDLPPSKIRVWRMGVPAHRGYMGELHREGLGRPILGTVGHDFPWKCFRELARCTADVGWGLLILTPQMSAQHMKELHTINPATSIRIGRAVDQVIADLSLCDATAFTYVTHNTGQSGAVTLGIAAKKPILALRTCRQFRCYYEASGSAVSSCFWWADTFEHIRSYLRNLMLGRFDARVTWLGEQDSWARLGAKYVGMWREVLGVAAQ